MSRKSIVRVALLLGVYLSLYGALLMSSTYPALAVLAGFVAGMCYAAVMEVSR